MSYDTIAYEISECILTITLNRPEKLNAFTAVVAERETAKRIASRSPSPRS